MTLPKTNTPSVESILNTVIDAIIVIDETGIIQSVNPAVEKLFGYTPEELIGKNVSMLMPNPYSREHDGYLSNYIRTGQAKIIGIGREVLGKKKDGTMFPIYLGVSEGRKEGDRRFFTGVIRDITEVRRYQDDLKKQGEFTAAVLNTVRSLVLVLDRRGRIVNFNQACEDTTGYSFQEVAGKPFWDFFLTMEDRDAVIKNFLNADPKHLVNNFETVWLTKKREKRLIAWSNSLLLDKTNSPEYVIGTGIDITERRQLEQMVLEITKKEQQRLGQELHDGIAQHLASTAIVAKALEQRLTRQSSPAARDLKRVVGMVNQAVTQTRELAQGLYALEIQSEDLVSSLKKLARDTEKTLDVHCAVKIDAGIHVSDEAVSAHLYRIAREAISNAVKHGRGKNIRIQLKKKGARAAELRIENDGKRFSKTNRKKGLGLHIMRSRAAMLNASIEIVPGPGGGTVISCIFPVS
mgnify:CR=1 FL=1